MAEHVYAYAEKLVRVTRPKTTEALESCKKWLTWGAGPRASLNLIVAGIQKADIQDIYHHPFDEENNLWVDAVSQTLLCYYEPVLLLPEQNLALYAPLGEAACSR